MEEGSTGDPNLAPGEKRTYRFTVTPPITAPIHAALIGGHKTFAVLGEFTYQDIFGTEERSTPVCVYFEARSMPLLSGCRIGSRDVK
jgi:hypothetical protein